MQGIKSTIHSKILKMNSLSVSSVMGPGCEGVWARLQLLRCSSGRLSGETVNESREAPLVTRVSCGGWGHKVLRREREREGKTGTKKKVK